eukprot:Rhum_TRINITY_DN14606_c17_g1::Rhum_TRINITY_DN14606_c17_g1_i1::g.104193::m.104193
MSIAFGGEMPTTVDAAEPPTPPSQMMRETRLSMTPNIWTDQPDGFMKGASPDVHSAAKWPQHGNSDDLAVSVRLSEAGGGAGWSAPTPAPTPMKAIGKPRADEKDDEDNANKFLWINELVQMLGDGAPIGNITDDDVLDMRETAAVDLPAVALHPREDAPGAEGDAVPVSKKAGWGTEGSAGSDLFQGLTGFLSPHAEPPTPFSTPIAGIARSLLSSSKRLPGAHTPASRAVGGTNAGALTPSTKRVSKRIFHEEPEPEMGMAMPPLLPMEEAPHEDQGPAKVLQAHPSQQQLPPQHQQPYHLSPQPYQLSPHATSPQMLHQHVQHVPAPSPVYTQQPYEAASPVAASPHSASPVASYSPHSMQRAPPPPPLYTVGSPHEQAPPQPLHHVIEPPPLLDASARVQHQRQQQQQQSALPPGPSVQVSVEFKMGRTCRYDAPSSCNALPEGTQVIVKGDRGEHMGRIRHNTSPSRAAEHQESEGLVLRVATQPEMEQFQQHSAMEEEALQTCAKKVAETGLVMDLCYAEYQFDLKKLTFYYRSETRQDFRDLIRDLYKVYRARIWMAKIKE